MSLKRKPKPKPKAQKKPKAKAKARKKPVSKPKPKVRKKLGRKPTVANKEIVEALIEALKLGNTIETACYVAGINPDTYYTSIETGKADIEAEKSTVFSEFTEKTTRARARVQSFVAGSILAAVSEDWRAGAFLLTHGPEKSAWAEKSKLELSGDSDSPVRVQTEQLTTAEWMAKYHEAVTAAATEPKVVEAPGREKKRKEG